MRVSIVVLVLAVLITGGFLILAKEETSDHRPPRRASSVSAEQLDRPDEPIEPIIPVVAKPLVSGQASENHEGGESASRTPITQPDPDSREGRVLAAIKKLLPDWNGSLSGVDLDAAMNHYAQALRTQTHCDFLVKTAGESEAEKIKNAKGGMTFGSPESDFPTLEAAEQALAPSDRDYFKTFKLKDEELAVVVRFTDNRAYRDVIQSCEKARATSKKQLLDGLASLKQ
jgi:hypothetical protein